MRKEQKRNLIVTFIIAAVLLAVYVFLVQAEKKQSGNDNTVVYTMEADAVTALSYKSGDENVSLVKKDGTWYDAEDESFPLNQKFLETMVNKTAQLKAQRYVGNGDKAFSQYGLENPSNVITVTTADKEVKILLGDTNGATGDCYMAVEGAGKVYTVDATFQTLFSNGLTAMAARESLPEMKLEGIMSVQVENNGESIAFEKQENDVWVMADGAEADSGLVTELIGKIMKLRYEAMVVYRPEKGKLAEYGLDKPQARIAVTYKDADGNEKTYELLVSSQGPLGEGADKATRYVCAQDGQAIYTMRESNLDSFFQLTPEAFLSLNVAPVKKEQFDTLTVTTAAGNAEFSIKRDAGRNAETYALNGTEITEAEFNSVYYQLYAFSAERRVSDIAGQLTKDPVLTCIYSDSTGNNETVQAELIPYDQNYYGAKVNGKAFLLVNRQRVNEILSEISKYIVDK